MCDKVNQLQTIQKEKSLKKARFIAAAKRVRWSKASRNIWQVESGNPKTSRGINCIRWEEGLDCFVSDCKVFEFSTPALCKYIYSCAILEGCNA
jgi:hypothetical protein